MRSNIVFVVDDKKQIDKHINFLTKKNFDVLICDNYDKAFKIINGKRFDVLAGMIEINDTDIENFVKQIDSKNINKPIIISLTKETASYEAIFALNSGAQSVFNINQSSKLFFAQINALLKFGNKEQVINYPGLVIDSSKHKVLYKGKQVNLSVKEFYLLFYISSKKGSICWRDELINQFWSKSVKPRIIDTYISNIRSKTSNNLIECIHGIGYRLNLEDYS
jgi:DNA-binding response OmpR family regulator